MIYSVKFNFLVGNEGRKMSRLVVSFQGMLLKLRIPINLIWTGAKMTQLRTVKFSRIPKNGANISALVSVRLSMHNSPIKCTEIKFFALIQGSVRNSA